jgi:hypothetical protein
MFVERSSSALKPQPKLISDRIALVRKNRGKKAAGDVLLCAAQRALCSNRLRTAKKDITKFLQITSGVTPEERAILTDIGFQITVQDLLRLLELVLKLSIVIAASLFTSASRTPMGYNYGDQLSRTS